MKQKITAAFGTLPVAVQAHLFGQFQDILAACDSHPALVPLLLENIVVMPEFDDLRSALGSLREQLVASL